MCSSDQPSGPAGPAVAFARFPGWDFKFPASQDQLGPVATDYFHDMDGAIALNDDEIKGRNTWLMWTTDNSKFWNWLAGNSFGTTDLLKVLDSRKRSTRFHDIGLMNEPGFRTAS